MKFASVLQHARFNSPSSSLNGSTFVYNNDPILKYCNVPESLNSNKIVELPSDSCSRSKAQNSGISVSSEISDCSDDAMEDVLVKGFN